MCGILGFIPREKSISDFHENLLSCLNLLTHRGPDSVGTFYSESAFLGIRRLSIQDVDRGDQPFFSEDKKICVVGNGEIYNFEELKRELSSKANFNSNSDVEVVLHGYIAHGVSFFEKLRGMFSLLIVDHNKSILIAVRDRIGEKPLYVHKNEDGIVFSSEIRPVIKSGLASFEFDETGLQDYLQYGFPLQPSTLVKNFRHVMPGTFEVFSLKDLSSVTTEYWHLDEIGGKANESEIESGEETLRFVEQCILKTEVNSGIALSSGLDSSSLLKLGSIQGSLRNAYHLRFLEDDSADTDKTLVKSLAETNGVALEEILINTDEYVNEFWDFYTQADQPIADWSGVSYNLIARRARENGEKVLIFGQGPDELFWGYNWVSDRIHSLGLRKDRFFGKNNLLSYLKNWQRPRGRFEKLIWAASLFGIISNLCNYILDSLAISRKSKQIRLFETRRGRLERKFSISKLVGSRSNSQVTYIRNFLSDEKIDVSVMKLMIETYLRSNGLLQLDAIGMRNSIEIRNPYVDYKLVERAIAACHGGDNSPTSGEKALFKDLVGHLVSDTIRSKRKVGFLPPIEIIATKLRDKNYYRLVEPNLLKQLKLDAYAVDILLNPLRNRRKVRKLWLELFVLEAWLTGILSDGKR